MLSKTTIKKEVRIKEGRKSAYVSRELYLQPTTQTVLNLLLLSITKQYRLQHGAPT